MTVSHRSEGALRRAMLILALAFAPTLVAVTPRVVTSATARDFLAGDAKGTAITAEGRLTLAPPLSVKKWPEDAADAVVFAAVSDPSGDVFVATGGGFGRLYVSSPDGTISLLYTAPEANLTAVAIAPDGAVVCASSPNGGLYRIDRKEIERSRAKKTGATAQDWGSPKEAAIWALAFAKDGTLYVGTGNKGRVYRRAPAGTLALLREIDDVHVRTLAVAADGKIWAGTSDSGLLVAISPDGSARTVHDFGRPEVIGIVPMADGMVYAAATNAEPPSVGASTAPEAKPTQPPSTASREEVPKGTVTVTTSAPRLATGHNEPSREKGAEIVVVSPDGFVEPGWIFPDETIYSLRLDPKREELVVATGPRGRVYSWKARHVTLEAQTEQAQVVAAPAVPDGFAAVTMAAPGVFRPEAGHGASGTYTSPSKDTGRLSRFGRIRFDGVVPKGSTVSFSVRAGNAEKPDRTWSEWTPVKIGDSREGTADVPAARFFQWRAELKSSPSGSAPSLERIEWSYSERNARPVLESVGVLEPGAVFAKSGSSPTAVLSVSNPDENGIYAGLEAPREGGEGPGKRLYRKGYRTITWKGVDPNGDSLRYEVDGRREGESVWFPIRKDIEEAYLSFDTTALPDGPYRFRVTASDRMSNPEGQALTASDESALVVVDNTPPVLKIEARHVEGGDVVLVVRATDELSPISKAEGALSADRWRILSSQDGLADGMSESFTLRVPKPAGPAVLSVRVLDASGNTAAVSAEYPREFGK